VQLRDAAFVALYARAGRATAGAKAPAVLNSVFCNQAVAGAEAAIAAPTVPPHMEKAMT
jgi:hypothetical protein